MIAAMSKATVLVLDSRREAELASLKRVGLLHPEIEERTDEKTAALDEARELLSRALAELDSIAGDSEVAQQTPEDALQTARHIHATAEHMRGREEVIERISEEISRVEPWGDFEPGTLEELAESGVELCFYSMATKEFKRRGPEAAMILERGASVTRFAIGWLNGHNSTEITREELDEDSGIERFAPGELSLAGLHARVAEETAEIERLEAELKGLLSSKDAIQAEFDSTEKKLRDEHVRLGMDTAEKIAFITGYVPQNETETLKQAAANNGWGVLIREPDPEDEVPTKVVNRGPVKLIRPMFDFLGVIPGYRERDISIFFLLFFIIFVGMIIGDAGYGALLLLGSILMLIRAKQKLLPALLLVLGISTVAWGGMTGNWFGYEPFGDLYPLSLIVVPALDTFEEASTTNVQRIAFMLAVVHLCLAHAWNFFTEIRERPRIKALAQLGSLSMVIGLYLLVLSLFVGAVFPSYGMYLIGGGLAFVIIFGQQSKEKGFFGGIGSGFGNLFITFIDSIGSFSDVVSYIRLFAVGLATVQIAQAFNSMAAGVSDGIVGIIGASVILALGHTLNVVMAGLAVIVHGVRLNLLEFSGHLGMEWTGIKYEPYS